MATPPTFVAESESSFVVNTTPKAQSLAVTAGDRITVVGATGNNLTTIGTPSDGVNTYTLVDSIVITDFCAVYIWKATAATTTTLSISLARGGTGGDHWGFNAFNDNGSNGFGASAKGNVSNAAPSVAITTTGDNSALYVISADWNALTGARTWRTVNGNTPTSGNGQEKTYVADTGIYTVYIARYPDAGTAGSKTVGLSAPTGQKYSLIALEVLGTTTGTDVTASDTTAALRAGGDSGNTVTIGMTATDTPGGLRLGGASTASVAVGATTADTPTGVRVGGPSTASVAVGGTASDAPSGLRAGGDSGASVTIGIAVADTPSGLRVGPAATASVTFDLLAGDTPSGLRVGGNSSTSAGAVTLVSDAPSGLRLGGDSRASVTTDVVSVDTPVGLRVGGNSRAAASADVVVTDTPSGLRIGSASASAVAASVVLGDTPTGLRLGLSPASVTIGSGGPTDVTVADGSPTGLRLGTSGATVLIGSATVPEPDIIVTVEIVQLGVEKSVHSIEVTVPVRTIATSVDVEGL